MKWLNIVKSFITSSNLTNQLENALNVERRFWKTKPDLK